MTFRLRSNLPPVPDWKKAITIDALDGLLRKIHKERGLDRSAVARLLSLNEAHARRFIRGTLPALPVPNWLLLAVRAIDAGITMDDIVYPDAVQALAMTASEAEKKTDEAINKIRRASWLVRRVTSQR